MSLDLNEVVRLLAAGNIPSPRLEARILLEHVGGSPFAEVDGEAEQKLRRLVERRLAHVPLDKLLGRREFYKNDFIVSEDVLTPRPDTEILVEAAIGLVRRNGLKRILDLGTGSGCIILSILDDCPQACGTAVDKSAAALEIARRNAAWLGLSERVAFVCRSWFDDDFVRETGTGFDMIVSNPPYIPTADIASLEPEVREHDPLSALDGGADGFAHYEKIASLAPLLLKKGGYILLEAGIGQARHISEVFAGRGLSTLEIRPDLAGTERCVILKK